MINVLNLDIKSIRRNEQLDYLICPECEEIALITFNKDKISIENCPNNHKLSNLSIDEFMDFQHINVIKLISNVFNVKIINLIILIFIFVPVDNIYVLYVKLII